MIRFRDALRPENVLLGIKAGTREEAVHRVAQSLQNDARVVDWRQFYHQLVDKERGNKVTYDFGLALVHIRTDVVTEMVMAFGRLAPPLDGPAGFLQFLFVIGVPNALDAEYLRVLGLLMRIFRDSKSRKFVLEAAEPAAILELFEQEEIELKQS